jgi:hypothetical protein
MRSMSSGRPGSLIPEPPCEEGGSPAVDQLGRNAFGEVLEPGRVADCYLGLLLPPGPAGELEAGTVLVVASARRPVSVATAPAGDTRRGRASAGVRNLDGMRTATADVSDSICGMTAAVSERAAGLLPC